MTGTSTRPLGATGADVTALTLGTSALGRTERVDDDTAAQVLATALDAGLTVDTSNEYGGGNSEVRVGRAWAARPGTASTLATKVDPLPGGPFDAERVRTSIAESRERLGTDHLPLVSLHDPERISFEDAVAPDGPWRALLELREQGVVGAVGVAGGPVGLLRRFVATGEAQYVVTHNRWTLLDRSADALLDDCAERGLGVFNAAPFGGGLLAKGPGAPGATYAYREAPPALLDAATAMAAACERHGTDLATAALVFSLREPRVTSTIAGVTRVEQWERALAQAGADLPDELFAELEEHLPGREHWLLARES
ncbi:aldo/keto reductase [Kineococcus sp. SYSU DK004]|uniref:aldo/keto reductase n=1 Tax=Kineococcus sp. SYSU DK004 TaxID=3383125 RepID=UPI003D7D84D1